MDQEGAPGPAPEEPVTTRDWAWGLVVVVGGTVLAVASAIWVLANLVFGCGCTTAAPGS